MDAKSTEGVAVLVFLDTEFTDFVRPDLISIGLVAEDGREFYAERTDYYPTRCSDFVKEAVLPLLGRVPGAACTRTELTDRLRDWFGQLPEPAIVIFDYEWDWRLLAVAMLGRPHSKPPGDFAKQLYLDSNAITHPVFEQELNRTYTQDWPQHHALADARALMSGYRAWRASIEPGGAKQPITDLKGMFGTSKKTVSIDEMNAAIKSTAARSGRCP